MATVWGKKEKSFNDVLGISGSQSVNRKRKKKNVKKDLEKRQRSSRGLKTAVSKLDSTGGGPIVSTHQPIEGQFRQNTLSN